MKFLENGTRPQPPTSCMLLLQGSTYIYTYTHTYKYVYLLLYVCCCSNIAPPFSWHMNVSCHVWMRACVISHKNKSCHTMWTVVSWGTRIALYAAWVTSHMNQSQHTWISMCRNTWAAYILTHTTKHPTCAQTSPCEESCHTWMSHVTNGWVMSIWTSHVTECKPSRPGTDSCPKHNHTHTHTHIQTHPHTMPHTRKHTQHTHPLAVTLSHTPTRPQIWYRGVSPINPCRHTIEVPISTHTQTPINKKHSRTHNPMNTQTHMPGTGKFILEIPGDIFQKPTYHCTHGHTHKLPHSFTHAPMHPHINTPTQQHTHSHTTSHLVQGSLA